MCVTAVHFVAKGGAAVAAVEHSFSMRSGSTAISSMSIRLPLFLTLLSFYTTAAQPRLYYMLSTAEEGSPAAGLRVPRQDDLQSIVSSMLTRVNENNSEARHVRKQIFSRKFWKR
ncbi:hypothetical protein Q1695_011204 [Nippostrongylus brasiliensis]|nr:hypothetical protein Q1695_011204 [Nippostrongylus brasiliensis]